MPIGIIPMLRRQGAARSSKCQSGFNAYRHYPYVETMGDRLPRAGLDGFNAYRHYPYVETAYQVAVTTSVNWFQCLSALSLC